MGEVYIRLLRESVRVRLHGLRRFVHCNHKTDAALKCVGLVQSGSVQCDVSHTHEINDTNGAVRVYRVCLSFSVMGFVDPAG